MNLFKKFVATCLYTLVGSGAILGGVGLFAGVMYFVITFIKDNISKDAAAIGIITVLALVIICAAIGLLHDAYKLGKEILGKD